jgi:hypothetical protein
MLHVEILSNEWAAGRQQVVARFAVNGTGCAELVEGDASWSAAILKPFRDPATGEEVAPDDGERFVQTLHRHLAGDYLFATEAHEEGECELHVGDTLGLQPGTAAVEVREPHHIAT